MSEAFKGNQLTSPSKIARDMGLGKCEDRMQRVELFSFVSLHHYVTI